jgi:hypothetical protein
MPQAQACSAVMPGLFLEASGRCIYETTDPFEFVPAGRDPRS